MIYRLLISNVLKPVLFADDTVFIHSDSNFYCLISNFNNELTKINLRLVRNRLTLNIDKTVSLIFSNRKQAIDSNNKLRIANSHVNFETITKYLGITIDHNLCFKNLIIEVCNKI